MMEMADDARQSWENSTEKALRRDRVGPGHKGGSAGTSKGGSIRDWTHS